MSKKQSKQPDWKAIRIDCEKRDRSSFSAIAAVHGISVATLRKRRKIWEKSRRAPKEGDTQKVAPVDAVTARPLSLLPSDKSEASIDHLAMVRRLYHATDQQIRHLEQQLQNGSAAFDEKEARMLGTIARTLDKIMELNPQGVDQDDAKKEGCDGEDRDEDAGTLDLLREELARRLDGLKQGSTNEFSGEPDTQ
nr:hypothetical protein [uncultured Cohaesibacter sp.]